MAVLKYKDPVTGETKKVGIPSDDIAKEHVGRTDNPHNVTAEQIGAAEADHNHDGVYAPANHNHDGVYATADHNHDGVYAPAIVASTTDIGAGASLPTGTLYVVYE